MYIFIKICTHIYTNIYIYIYKIHVYICTNMYVYTPAPPRAPAPCKAHVCQPPPFT